MRIYVQQDGAQLGPFSPEEVVEELRADRFTAQDAAWVEGDTVWRQVVDALFEAGLTPSGRPVSKKLRPPASQTRPFIVPVAPPPPDPVHELPAADAPESLNSDSEPDSPETQAEPTQPERATIPEFSPVAWPPPAPVPTALESPFAESDAPPVAPPVDKAPSLRPRAEEEGVEDGFNWSSVRKLGMAAPVLVLITMFFPWYTLMALFRDFMSGAEAADLWRAQNGFGVMRSGGQGTANITLFAIFVIGIAWFSFRASFGDDSASSWAFVCALVALLFLLYPRWVLRHKLGAADFGSGLGLGGGLHLCAMVLFVCAALARVPLEWRPETSGRMFTAIAIASVGLFFGVKGTIFLFKYDKFIKGKSSFLAAERPTETGQLESKSVGDKSFCVPEEWAIKKHDSASLRAAQPRRLSMGNTFMDNLQWAIYPITNDGSDYQKALATAFNDEASFRNYVNGFLIPSIKEALGPGADGLAIESVEPVSKGSYSGFDCVMGDAETTPGSGSPVAVRSRLYMVRSGSEVINGVLYAEEGRFEQRSRLFQFCIDESVFEKAER